MISKLRLDMFDFLGEKHLKKNTASVLAMTCATRSFSFGLWRPVPKAGKHLVLHVDHVVSG